MKRTCALPMLMLLACPAVASADPIVFFVTRNATATASVDPARPSSMSVSNAGNPVIAGTSAYRPDGQANGSSFLVTGTDPSNLWGRGGASTYVDSAGWADAQGGSFYFVGIRLDQPFDFIFDAGFTGDDTVSTPEGTTVTRSWIAMLRDAPTGTNVFRDTGAHATTLAHTGTLAAGDWQLYITDYTDAFARLGGIASARSNYTFSLGLSPASAPMPTPEPATVFLLGGGIAALLARRRNR